MRVFSDPNQPPVAVLHGRPTYIEMEPGRIEESSARIQETFVPEPLVEFILQRLHSPEISDGLRNVIEGNDVLFRLDNDKVQDVTKLLGGVESIRAELGEEGFTVLTQFLDTAQSSIDFETDSDFGFAWYDGKRLSLFIANGISVEQGGAPYASLEAGKYAPTKIFWVNKPDEEDEGGGWCWTCPDNIALMVLALAIIIFGPRPGSW